MVGPTQAATGRIQVLARLIEPPLAVVAGDKRTESFTLTGDQQRSYVQQLSQKQAQLMAQVSALGGEQIRCAHEGSERADRVDRCKPGHRPRSCPV